MTGLTNKAKSEILNKASVCPRSPSTLVLPPQSNAENNANAGDLTCPGLAYPSLWVWGTIPYGNDVYVTFDIFIYVCELDSVRWAMYNCNIFLRIDFTYYTPLSNNLGTLLRGIALYCNRKLCETGADHLVSRRRQSLVVTPQPSPDQTEPEHWRSVRRWNPCISFCMTLFALRGLGAI